MVFFLKYPNAIKFIDIEINFNKITLWNWPNEFSAYKSNSALEKKKSDREFREIGACHSYIFHRVRRNVSPGILNHIKVLPNIKKTKWNRIQASWYFVQYSSYSATIYCFKCILCNFMTFACMKINRPTKGNTSKMKKCGQSTT